MSDNLIKYASLFNSSDTFSIKAQAKFVSLNKWTLIALVLSTAISSITQENWAIWTSTALLLLTATLSTLMLLLRFEKGWYEGRAVAESIKTLCWKFMIGAKPFTLDLEPASVQKKLIDNFKKVIGQRKDFFTLIGSDFAEDEQLPNELTEIRNLPLDHRLFVYKTQRLEKQKKWYTDKATENKKWTRMSFFVIIATQLIALIYLVLNIKYEFSFTIAPTLIAISTAFMAWMQLRRFQELSQSYLITGTELSLIKSKIGQVESDEDFSDFVDDSETAISREYTLWLARRDNIELFK
ncbi:DUF4231 domain-containing protein [Hyunsoonleella pacifica]|uniref:DUF4231 domain-containing protein n=1 Tax=Hyunsoonleella pacifica TaxID=1080224 RepID=A0A4Q9FRT3_9FLAO|nr:DUF4231 domain-containing protein [Hyunsoonleella pacifica]TBN17566.1 DUF4231 domain-containing protein [Hyunsoonleella pacifica]GGD10844.1 membrane protein [Hyunsoonleella pacifica]